jgi:hypothetical protein
MSGSGSSVFALTASSEDTGHLQRRFLAEFGQTLFSTPFTITNADL